MSGKMRTLHVWPFGKTFSWQYNTVEFPFHGHLTRRSSNFNSPKFRDVSIVSVMWLMHTGCLQDWVRDQNRDMDEWVVWFSVEPFTLHLNRDREEWITYPFFRFWNFHVVCFNISIFQWFSGVQSWSQMQLGQYEQFLNNISPGPGPCSGTGHTASVFAPIFPILFGSARPTFYG